MQPKNADSNAEAARQVLAKSTPDLGMVSEILGDIVQDGIQAGEVIRRLRGLLRRGERKSDPVDMNALLESTLRMLRSELLDRRVRVGVTVADHLPTVVGDPVQLQQLLLNLLMNAMEAMNSTPDARRLIEVTTRLTAAGGIEVEIADRGPGIASEERESLFQPFFTTKEHGLGLGLSICLTIVSSHGGKLSISNISSGGAAAVLSLPPHKIIGAAP